MNEGNGGGYGNGGYGNSGGQDKRSGGGREVGFQPLMSLILDKPGKKVFLFYTSTLMLF